MKITYKIKYKKMPVEGSFEAGVEVTTMNQLIKLLRGWLQRSLPKFNPMLVGEGVVGLVQGKSVASIAVVGMSCVDPDFNIKFKAMP